MRPCSLARFRWTSLVLIHDSLSTNYDQSKAGYEKILVAIGDHELGGNAWRPTKNNEKNRLQPQFRQSFSNEFNKNSSTQDFLFQESIGKATSSPEGTPYNDTSYAHRHKNVLFITINAFAKVRDGTE